MKIRQHQSGEADIEGVFAVVATVLVACVIFITWPASLAVLMALLVWLLTRDRRSAIWRSLNEAALPVLIGTGLIWTATLTVVLLPEISNSGRRYLLEGEQMLLQARRAVHALSGPDLGIYLLILGVLLASLCFFPESRAIGRLLRTKKQLARLHLCLLALTSFTFFGSREADKLEQKDHETQLSRLEVSLRNELEPAETFLARNVANEAVITELNAPTPESTKARLRFLVESFRGPVYIDVKVRAGWALSEPGARKLERVRIADSSVIKTFIDHFSKEVSTQEEASGNAAQGSNVQGVARQLLGGVAESTEEWRQQQQLIEEEEARAEKSKELYKEASTGITEAVTTSFSAALEALTPEINGLANEWISELVDISVIPSVERKIESRVQAVLRWSRDNVAAGRIRDVPEQLRQEIRPSVLRQVLFPDFLKDRRSVTAAQQSAEIPQEIAAEIHRRVEIARTEVEQRERRALDPPPDIRHVWRRY
jgi:hypothetical protein